MKVKSRWPAAFPSRLPLRITQLLRGLHLQTFLPLHLCWVIKASRVIITSSFLLLLLPSCSPSTLLFLLPLCSLLFLQSFSPLPLPMLLSPLPPVTLSSSCRHCLLFLLSWWPTIRSCCFLHFAATLCQCKTTEILYFIKLQRSVMTLALSNKMIIISMLCLVRVSVRRQYSMVRVRSGTHYITVVTACIVTDVH